MLGDTLHPWQSAGRAKRHKAIRDVKRKQTPTKVPDGTKEKALILEISPILLSVINSYKTKGRRMIV